MTQLGERRRGGFSLVETLVALSLLAVAMLLTLSLVFQEPRALARIAAHEEAFRVLEQVAEAIRAGRTVPLGEHPIDPGWLRLPEQPAARDLEVWSDRWQETASGLYRLTLSVRYRAGRQWYERSLETFVWYPG